MLFVLYQVGLVRKGLVFSRLLSFCNVAVNLRGCFKETFKFIPVDEEGVVLQH